MSKLLELTNILKELYNISGFRISLYDSEKRLLCAFPEQLSGFCQLVQQNTYALKLCRQYDSAAFQTAMETGEAYVYRCCFGLYEAVTPLYHFGVLSGYLMMGQTLDSLKSSTDFTYQAALPYVSCTEQLQECIKKIPIRSKSQILSCITIMEICAAYITLSNRLNITNKDLPSKVQQYINQNYASKITLDHLCNSFYCSRATLTSAFRNVFHQTIHEYLTQVRLEHSTELLKNTSLNMEAVSEQCGFSDQNYFTKVFRKNFNQTPSQYRNQNINPALVKNLE